MKRSLNYGAVREDTREERSLSKMAGMRKANNVLKRVLINAAFEHARRAFPTDASVRVYDMCAGKGGDIMKFLNAARGVRRSLLLHAVDAEQVSVDFAHGRAQAQSKEFRAEREEDGVRYPEDRYSVREGDCFAPGMTPRTADGEAFHIVSCQMALHYAAESEQRFNDTLDNIAAALEPNGVFVVSYAEGSCMLDYARLERQNDICSARLQVETLPEDSFFGVPVHVCVGTGEERRVNGVEYLLPAEVLEAGLARRGFTKVMHTGFHRLWDDATRCQTTAAMFRRDNVRLSRPEWDVIGLYAGGVFVKNAV